MNYHIEKHVFGFIVFLLITYVAIWGSIFLFKQYSIFFEIVLEAITIPQPFPLNETGAIYKIIYDGSSGVYLLYYSGKKGVHYGYIVNRCSSLPTLVGHQVKIQGKFVFTRHSFCGEKLRLTPNEGLALHIDTISLDD